MLGSVSCDLLFCDDAAVYGDFRSVRSTISAAALVDFAVRRGLTRAAALAGSGITESDLSDASIEISVDQELAIVRNIVRAGGDEPGLGLMAGLEFNLAMLGGLGIVLSTCATVGEMAEIWVRYAELSFVYVRYDLDVDGPEVVLNLDGSHIPEDVRRFAVERDLATLRMVQRGLLDWDMSIRRLEVHYAACPVYEAVGKLLNVDEIVFESPRTCLVLDAADLEKPMPQANPAIMRQYEQMCAEIVQRRKQRSGLSGRVRELLIHRDGLADQQRVAADLGMSVRTLRRRLFEEGNSFRALCNETTGILAVELLSNGLTVETVATRLGYASVSAFTSAFRAETGKSPGQVARETRVDRR